MDNPTRREPAVLLIALLTPILQLISLWLFSLTDEQQSLISGAVSLVLGVVTAWRVSAEKGLALLSGAVQAVIALAVGFGLELDPAAQTAILAIVAIVTGYYVRTQVFAPIPAQRAPEVIR